MKSKRIDPLVLSTFLTTLFYSATYPYINKIIISSVSTRFIAVNQILNCLSIIIFNSIWTKYHKKLYDILPLFCISESIATISCTIYCIIFKNIISYYIIDTILFTLITRNIICGYSRLCAKRYRDEDSRAIYENKVNIASAAATIIGSTISMILQLDFEVMLMIAAIGNSIDNTFYIFIHKNTPKGEIKNEEKKDVQ